VVVLVLAILDLGRARFLSRLVVLVTDMFAIRGSLWACIFTSVVVVTQALSL
jgi:hypothetical protein